MINVQLSPLPSAITQPTELKPPVTSHVVHDNRETYPPPRQPAETAPRRLSRPRRDLQNPGAALDSRKVTIRQFAEALVEDGDQQLAISVANSLIRQRLASETRRPSEGQDRVAVPPYSTFGRAWAELADALHAEPFKSFAESQLIDVSNLIIGASGDLTEKKDGGFVKYYSSGNPLWSASSAAVLAAAKKLANGRASEVIFYDRDHAPTHTVAQFYDLQLGSINSNDTLSSVGQLYRDGTFKALTSANPLDAPVKQRQREARQQLTALAPQALSKLLETFTPSTAEKKVQHADRELAQLCSQGLVKLMPEAGEYDYPVVLESIPEYSTFNLARKNLLNALTASAFTTFAHEQNLDPTSVVINPVSGDLTGKVNGVNTSFNLNDISGWGEVWNEVQGAVQHMAAGSGDDVNYPTGTSAPLYEVMAFYNEALPHQQEPQQKGWEQRQLVATLGRMAEISQNNGFKALIDANADDTDSVAVRERQQAMTQQLSGTTVTPSSLEALAAAIPASSNAPAYTHQPPVDDVASAENALAVTVHKVMLELKADPASAASKRIVPIPAGSLFGQWKAYAHKTLSARGYAEFLRANNLSSYGGIWVPPKDATDARTRIANFAKEHPEYFDAMTHMDAAMAPFARDKPIALDDVNSDSVPFAWVANFYGLSTDPSSAEFARQTALMARTQQFPNPLEHPEKIVNWLSQQKTAVGDSNDRYSLIEQLKNGNLSDDETTRFVVDPDSSHQPKGVTTLQKFLAGQNWYGATSAAETTNLLKALQTPIPQPAALGNHWGFLSTDIPLSAEQRTALTDCVKRSIGSHGSLLSYLSTSVESLSTDPAHALEQLLSSDSALELATTLQTEMDSAVTATSLKQWLLSALVLELDPTAGTQHKTVAGVDLMGTANAGYASEVIRERFNHYMTAEKGVPAHLAPVASRLLMAGMAPQLLVSDVPKTVTLGSPQWFTFTTAVNRIEWTAPGATANMTYQQVMNYHHIQPISDFETQIQSYAQMDPLLDWTAINSDVDKNNYTLEQLKKSQKTLQTQLQAIADSRNWLATNEAPNRRAMTLKVLRENFGTDIDYERRYMVESFWGGAVSGRHYSLAEIYEVGRLGEHWKQEGTHLDFERLRAKAKDLPVVKNDFDNAINADFNLRRRHTLTLFENMINTLPVQERNSITYGDVEFLNVEGAGSGMVMTSVYKGVRRDFAVYPAWGQIVRIADIDPATPLGQKVSLDIDAQAFKNGTEPRKGVKSEVILRTTDPHILDDNNQPWPLEVTFSAHKENDAFSPHYASSRISTLARVMVDSTYLNQTQFINLHRNWSSNTLETADEPSDFFKAVWHSLPGTSSLEDLYHGEFFKAGVDLGIDVAIFLATEGLGKLWTLAKSGATWAAAKVSAKFIEKFGAKDAANSVIKDVTAANASESLNALSRMQGSALPEQTADMANGSLTRSGTTIRATTVKQDGKWYFYNSKTQAAEGPAQAGFMSETSSVLRQETFSDGTQALVTEKSLAADAYTIPRSHGFDLVNEGKVYRYDTRNPGVLTDLTSADHFKPLEGFEAVCPVPSVGGNAKRGANDSCFSKVVTNVSDQLAQERQALEHVRLFPSPPKLFRQKQFVIVENRICEAVESETGQRMVPTKDVRRIDYKTKVTGSLKHDPQFGFFSAQTNDAFAQQTRVVKLNSISDMVDDKREIRGVIVNRPVAGRTEKYVVVEADTAQFYYAKLSNAPTGELNFFAATPLEQPLVDSYTNALTTRLGTSRVPFDADFIALPKLKSAFEELERLGYAKHDVQELRTFCKDLTEEQQREVVYQLQREKAIGKAKIAFKPNRVSALTKPAGFEALTVEQQNQFYAEQANASVNRSMKATGLGPGNKVLSKADSARAQAASRVNGWLRRTVAPHALNRADLILKTGAGNCGEMALVAKETIRKSGGRAYEWAASDAHAFTIVGGPSELPPGTVDFSGPEWADAWIVDPWSDIACPAREYTQKLKGVMDKWQHEKLVIMEGGKRMSPLDKDWLDTLIVKPKTPYAHGYNRT